MSTAKALVSTLKAFHLDEPEATWEELRDHLKAIAEDILQTSTEWERRDEQGLLYADWGSDLRAIVSTQGFTEPQAKAARMARVIMKAAEERLQGDCDGLLKAIDDPNKDGVSDSHGSASLSLSVGPPSASHQPISYSELSALQLAEVKANLAGRTFSNYQANDRTISQGFEALGVTDMGAHTRQDIVALKAHVGQTRKASSQNLIMSRLSTVLTWANNNGLIDHAYVKGLRTTGKGTESSREALTKEQQAAVMAHCETLPVISWERWLLSIGVITGARIGELTQLRKEDIREELRPDGSGGLWVIDINDNHGKTLKNSNSKRIVPLVDGALGFDLKAFLGQFLPSMTTEGPLCPVGSTTSSLLLNGGIRTALGLKEAGGELTFHSLRHSMAGRFKEQDVSAIIAGAVLGHSSQTITFDHYGKGQGVALSRLEHGMRTAFEISPANGSQGSANQ